MTELGGEVWFVPVQTPARDTTSASNGGKGAGGGGALSSSSTGTEYLH